MAVDQFCLKWNNFHSSLILAFESLQTTEDLADVTLTTEGVNIKAHKIILSACSPYFRSIFKENPCSHPIVILKDVFYDDLLAILKFMYHGEVLVAKDRLHSFLQTGEVLQVSGLIGCTDFSIRTTTPKTSKPKIKEPEISQPVLKKAKFIPKPPKKSDYSSRNLEATQSNIVKDKKICQMSSLKDNMDIVCADKIKMEIDDIHLQSDVNENLGCFPNLVEKPISILETVLETKDNPSILERSLMSNAIGTNTSGCYTDQQQAASELIKHLASTQKVAEQLEPEKHIPKQKTSIEYFSASTCNEQQRDNQTLIKTEEENIEVTIDLPNVVSDVGVVNIRPLQDVQPHHSSQCGNCPHCGKIYSNQSALKYHVRLVHSDLLNLYCCHLCPEVFDYREGYKKHMVEIHSIRN